MELYPEIEMKDTYLFFDRIDVSKQGKIRQKKLLKKRDFVNGCLTAD